ncbi:D-beta-D-heptose 7-phosphate kinase [Candidatus Velamenicoccus archaeovorus]|uniref:D-beta-D-heptose 7-phosphate kinase n=1 Tax=Velamenicoccus archaeovorus TaxID=1930593 RepID=A0A410P2P7_VELA1|nr:D-glycero-beta-D-manno-heptose-7-phosphate kinase [Candidatus Velamenicoccus archaeovorus]QAT16413.1 D-beta-D-heptose 7-phosphate kinase [Candidatus Velamenicoccus archaeovorus]
MALLTHEKLKKILGGFSSSRIMVIGDLILDEYIWGKAERISPEAPVPVVWAQRQSFMPGGASNVANNLAALGAKVFLCGVVGEDRNGDTLLDLLRQKGVVCDGVIADAARRTTVKTRIIAAHQQMVRLDWENTEHLALDRLRHIVAMVEEKIPQVDGLIIEDYGKGLIGPYLLKRIISSARRHGKIITVDPKIEHFRYYKGVTALTPNEKEASAGAGISIKTDEDIDRIGRKLFRTLRCEGVLVTLGEKGMKLFSGAGHNRAPVHIPTVAQEVFDVSGAGDTVISVFTLALSRGVSMVEAAKIANVAAGVVVGKVGVAVVAKEEILEAWRRLRGKLL